MSPVLLCFRCFFKSYFPCFAKKTEENKKVAKKIISFTGFLTGFRKTKKFLAQNNTLATDVRSNLLCEILF